MNKKLALVGLLTVSMLGACAEEARPIPAPSHGTPSSATPPPSPPMESSPAAPPSADIADVLGNVLDDAGDAVVGREVVIVDRLGKRERVLTDEGGTFGVRAVALPYDVKVAAAPSGSHVAPAVWLGLTRPDPQLRVVEHEGAITRAPAQRLKVIVNVKTCPAEACWVSVTSTSRSGSGAAGRTLATSETLAAIELDHVWTKPEIPSQESIEVAALIGDEAYSHVAFARATTLARPGEEAVLGLAPAAVEMTEPVTISASAEGMPGAHASWAFTLATRLVLPGGTAIGLHYVEGPALVTRMPRVDGARFEVDVWAKSHARSAPRASYARSGPIVLGTTDVAVDLPRVLDLVRPGEHGRLSRRAKGFAWIIPGPLARVTTMILENTAGHPRFRVMTEGDEVAFGRLRRLDIEPLELGDAMLDLATTIDRTLDEETSPEGAAAGVVGTTHQRVRFQAVR